VAKGVTIALLAPALSRKEKRKCRWDSKCPGTTADHSKADSDSATVMLASVDHGAIVLDRIALDPKVVLSNEFGVEYQDHLFSGVSVLRGKGSVVNESGWEGMLYRYREPSSKTMDITAIPYYAWDNRAPGEMRVWVRVIIHGVCQ